MLNFNKSKVAYSGLGYPWLEKTVFVRGEIKLSTYYIYKRRTTKGLQGKQGTQYYSVMYSCSEHNERTKLIVGASGHKNDPLRGLTKVKRSLEVRGGCGLLREPIPYQLD